MSVKILGIETSCDETAVAIVENGRNIISNIVYSQIDIHKKFGGVVPEVASRSHLDKISVIVDDALAAAGISFDEIDAIAVTYGPGLVGALLVGVSYAKGLSYALDKPLIAVNHIEGHISANYIEYKELEPPFLSLVVSGGHTHLVDVKAFGDYEIIGKTRDDAAGEAFDKVARTLGLGYPGGPLIDKLSKEGSRTAIDFPRTYLEKGSLDFSFSGIKSAVLNYVNNNRQKGNEINKADIAASFQEAVMEVLVNKTLDASKRNHRKNVVIAGGVAANSRLRELMKQRSGDINILYPPLSLCTDNAAMIAAAGYYKYTRKQFADLTLNAVPNLKLQD